ncbi:hypothetical protein GP486_003444 [Trichoglossum hirsutum]|uniref:Uncharacterized protein n=1 Tax=Trichoglossum hirsutum TaxID=265104 RepID=A0A9P8LCK4_9PEZI|nr:hypothetical protein GP486_003444 [Trichoglossum hirsutum]
MSSRSVIGRTIHSGLWPTLLQADSVQSFGVDLRVLFFSWLTTIGLCLVALASAVTPLGLEDKIIVSGNQVVRFVYVKDNSSFGLGTPTRPSLGISRLCGQIQLLNCPGQGPIDAVGVNSQIPDNITAMFIDATKDSTLSSIFDIQYRQYRTAIDKRIDSGNPHLQGSFRSLDSLILDNQIEVVEGLVVDTVNGGIGYRNHTAPTGLKEGATWREDLLWVEPVTECVDTNLTLHFSLKNLSYPQLALTSVYLRDDGGFANLAATAPHSGNWINTDGVPDLKARAHLAAWLSNYATTTILNITSSSKTGAIFNSTVGQRHDIPGNGYGIKVNGIKLTTVDGGYLNGTTNGPALLDFIPIHTACSGYDINDINDGTLVGVSCGYIYGTPYRSDGSSSFLFEPQTDWQQSMYVCASAVRASIKTVTFSLNGTAAASNLSISSVVDRVPTSNADTPIWALELAPQRKIADVAPLWGLISNHFAHTPGFRIRRAAFFFLPPSSQYKGLSTIMSAIDGLAATRVFQQALRSAYREVAGATAPALGIASYGGDDKYAVLSKWQTLSTTPASAGRIVNLIAVDLLASATVGTKSLLSSSSNPFCNRVLHLVRRASSPPDNTIIGRDCAPAVSLYRRHITYRKALYAFPAIALLALWAAVVGLALCFGCLTHRATPRVLRRLLNQTAVGRVAITLLRPDLCDVDATTRVWVERVGKVRLNFGRWDAKDLIEEEIEMAVQRGGDTVTRNNRRRELGIRIIEERAKSR